MERNVLYLLTFINVFMGFLLIYMKRSPFAGRKKKTK